jgi:hypothetical protein
MGTAAQSDFLSNWGKTAQYTDTSMYQGDMLSWTDFPYTGSYGLSGYLNTMKYYRANSEFAASALYSPGVTAFDLAQG